MRRRVILGVVAVMACIGWGWLCYQFFWRTAPVVAQGDGLLRFHVIANGDSMTEQAVKLKVRDAVLDYLAEELLQSQSMAEAREVVLQHEAQIVAVAERVVRDAGENDTVRMEVGRHRFPVRMYGDMVVPAGEYEAVRLIIGEGKGKNWWCVLFPPLCVVDAAVMTSESPNVSEEREVVYRSKLAELLGY